MQSHLLMNKLRKNRFDRILQSSALGIKRGGLSAGLKLNSYPVLIKVIDDFHQIKKDDLE